MVALMQTKIHILKYLECRNHRVQMSVLSYIVVFGQNILKSKSLLFQYLPSHEGEEGVTPKHVYREYNINSQPKKKKKEAHLK